MAGAWVMVRDEYAVRPAPERREERGEPQHEDVGALVISG